jgi:transposase InsO family protein
MALFISLLKNAIEIYNNKRLHVSIEYKTPQKLFEKAA